MNEQTISENCLLEMFRRVGLHMPDYAALKAWAKDAGPDWYQVRTWTSEQEDAFRDWMDAYVARHTSWGKRRRGDEIGMFMLMWGWKVEDE